jgi:pimeloyl-ACP methyl ester carboxylesterase
MRVRGVDLAVRESGQGLPFLWGHGLLGSMAQEDDADLLDWSEIQRSARLLRYDARGHGRSEATLDPADGHWGELGRDMLALADAFEAERAVLGGLSMGCATALHAAALAPGRVEALVLVAPPPPGARGPGRPGSTGCWLP